MHSKQCSACRFSALCLPQPGSVAFYKCDHCNTFYAAVLREWYKVSRYVKLAARVFCPHGFTTVTCPDCRHCQDCNRYRRGKPGCAAETCIRAHDDLPLARAHNSFSQWRSDGH